MDTNSRDRLVASLDKLRASLYHFQVVSAEYSAFVEEVETLPKNATLEEVVEKWKGVDGEKVTEQDVRQLLKNYNTMGGRDAVLRGAKHRIDYTEDNISKIKKQIEIGETALEEAKNVDSEGQAQTEEGLPIYEITEEVDDEGNLVNTEMQDAQGNIQRIGVKDLPDFERLIKEAAKSEKPIGKLPEEQKRAEVTKEPFPAAKPDFPKEQGEEKESAAPNLRAQKDDAGILSSSPKRDTAPIEYLKKLDDLIEDAAKNAERVKETQKDLPSSAPSSPLSKDSPSKHDIGQAVESVNPEPSPPPSYDIEEASTPDSKIEEVIRAPQGWATSHPDDTEEDAELRRQMLEYNYNEIGPIVAELTLEEEGQEDSDEEEEEWEDMTDSDEDEDEDEYGRSRRPVITDELRAEMAALQARLKAQGLAESLGSNATSTPSPTTELKSPNGDSKLKKSVKFNDKLDISPAPTTFPPKTEVERPKNAPKVPQAESLSPDTYTLNPNSTHPLPVLNPEDEDTVPFLAALLSHTEQYKAGLIPGVPKPGVEEAAPAEPAPVIVPKKEKKPSLFKSARTTVSETANTAAGSTSKSVPASVISETITESGPVRKPTTSNVVESASLPGSKYPSKPTPPIGDIIEAAPSKISGPQAIPPSLTRFRTPSSRTRSPSPPPSDPSTANSETTKPRPVLASEIRESTSPTPRKTAPPDELDPEILRREAAERLVKLQGKKVAREGGFGKTVEEEEEGPIVPLKEEEGGKKKVSRFRQMRMGGMG